MSERVLADEERLNRLRLIRSENIGPVLFDRLLERFGSATAALVMLPELSRKGGLKRPFRICSPASVASAWPQHR